MVKVRELKALRAVGGGGGVRGAGRAARASGGASGGDRATADGSTASAVIDLERREVELWEEVRGRRYRRVFGAVMVMNSTMEGLIELYFRRTRVHSPVEGDPRISSATNRGMCKVFCNYIQN